MVAPAVLRGFLDRYPRLGIAQPGRANVRAHYLFVAGADDHGHRDRCGAVAFYVEEVAGAVGSFGPHETATDPGGDERNLLGLRVEDGRQRPRGTLSSALAAIRESFALAEYFEELALFVRRARSKREG